MPGEQLDGPLVVADFVPAWPVPPLAVQPLGVQVHPMTPPVEDPAEGAVPEVRRGLRSEPSPLPGHLAEGPQGGALGVAGPERLHQPHGLAVHLLPHLLVQDDDPVAVPRELEVLGRQPRPGRLPPLGVAPADVLRRGRPDRHAPPPPENGLHQQQPAAVGQLLRLAHRRAVHHPGVQGERGPGGEHAHGRAHEPGRAQRRHRLLQPPLPLQLHL
mmetsp:Transcript_20441/g.35929  ORF Transcript_20441/g.35929 Transcript_20441/m.35929 type:complete len:215 (-) Transcript_20441:349-993(-)